MTPTRPLAVRFWAKVAVVYRPDGSPDLQACWLWTGAKCGGRPGGGDPYGSMKLGMPHRNKQRKAHVIGWCLHHGKWPSQDICHKCDTPLCCNPHHTFEASHRENMRDYAIKYGRLAVSKRPPPPRPAPFDEKVSV